MIQFLKDELAQAEAMEAEAAQEAEAARQYIANHARLQVIVAHFRRRIAQEQAAPPADPTPTA